MISGYGALVVTVVLISFTSHVLHSSYIFNREAPWYRLWLWQYNRFKYIVIRFLYRLGSRKFMQKNRFLRLVIIWLMVIAAGVI